MEFISNSFDSYQSSDCDSSITPTPKQTETEAQIHHNNDTVEEKCNSVKSSDKHGDCNEIINRADATFESSSGVTSNTQSSDANSVWMSSLGADLRSRNNTEIKKSDSFDFLEDSFIEENSCNLMHNVANDCKKNEEAENKTQGRFWFSRFSRKQIFTLFSICLVEFTSSMGMSIMAPFFPMEATQKGLDEALVGFVFSSYAVVMFVMSPIFGRLLPVIGPYFLFFSGLFLSAGCTILFGALEYMSGSYFLYYCFIVRSFEALGAAAFNTAACTIVAQIFPDNVSGVFGLTETFVGLGMTMGPAVGGALYTVGTFGLPFYSLGAFMVIMIPINIWLLPKEQTADVIVKSGSMRCLIKLPMVIGMILVTVVQATAWSFVDPFLQPHLNEFSLSSELVGLVFLMLSATYGIFCPIFGWIADSWDHTTIMMILGMCLTSLSLLLIGPSYFFPFLDNTIWLNIIALILLGLATPLAEIPTFQGMMDCAIDSGFPDNIGTYSLVAGIWSAAFSFGEFLGPASGGVLVKAYDFPTASTCIAGIVLLPILYITWYELWVRCKKEKSDHFSNLPQNIVPISTEATPLLKSL